MPRKRAYNKNSSSGVTISRHLGEAINIGDDIRVTYVERNGSNIRLLVQAPKDILINRENKEDTEILKTNGKDEEMVRRFLKSGK